MSRSPITIGNLTVNPGEMKRGGIPLGNDAYGQPRQLPLIVAHGPGDGPILWLNGATHGDEPEGPLSIYKLIPQLNPAELNGTLVMVPVMNVEAYKAGERGDPLDNQTYDMNRNYPGRENGYPTERVANAHWQAMKDQCDLQISIHSGGTQSYLNYMVFTADNPPSLELSAAMGPAWDLVFASPAGGNDPSSRMAGLGKAGITVELGGNCRTLTSDFHDVADALCDAWINVMRHYGMLAGDAAYAPSWRMGHQLALLAPETGLYVGNRDLPFGEEVPAGYLIGSLHNLYGDVIGEVRAPEAGVVFGMRFRPSVLAGQWCCFFGVVTETSTSLLG